MVQKMELKKIKVLRIIHRFALSGPMLNAVLLSEYLPSDKYETFLIGGEGDEGEENAEYIFQERGINYSKISKMKRSINLKDDIAAYLEICNIIKKFKPDIVHTHAAKSGTLGRLAAIRCKVPVVLHTFHGHVFHSYFSSVKTRIFISIERFLAKKSTKIIAISNLQKKELGYEFRICEPSKINVVPLGFKFDKFIIDQEIKRKKFRNEFSINEKTVAVGIIGRLAPIKNHRLFIDAAHNLLKETNQSVHFFIVGGGNLQSELEEYAQNKGIPVASPSITNQEAKMTFTSWRKDVDNVVAGMDIIALTSLNEGTPVSLIEAQAAGKPIVSTNVGGIEDVVLKGKTALLSETNNLNDFKNNLLQLVENEKVRNSMANVGREFVIEKFGYKRLVKDFDKLYNELLANAE